MRAVDRRAIGGRHVGGVDQVLDPDRDAVQRACDRLPVKLAGLFKHQVGIEVLPGPHCRFPCFNAVDVAARHGFDRHLTPCDGGGQFMHGQFENILHAVIPFK